MHQWRQLRFIRFIYAKNFPPSLLPPFFLNSTDNLLLLIIYNFDYNGMMPAPLRWEKSLKIKVVWSLPALGIKQSAATDDVAYHRRIKAEPVRLAGILLKQLLKIKMLKKKVQIKLLGIKIRNSQTGFLRIPIFYYWKQAWKTITKINSEISIPYGYD